MWKQIMLLHGCVALPFKLGLSRILLAVKTISTLCSSSDGLEVEYDFKDDVLERGFIIIIIIS